jgi:tetratricopeptide (TPR) repeat protein
LSRRAVLLTLLALALLGVGGWFAWRHYTAPVPPDVPLEGSDPAVAKAITEARQEILDDPRSSAPWGKLGMIFMVHNFGLQADVCFAKAEELDPTDRRWPYYRGINFMKRKPEEAIRHFRRAVELSDDDAIETRLRLAEQLLETHHEEEAEKYYREVYRLDEVNPPANLGLGQLARRRGDYAASLAYLERSSKSPFTRKAALRLLATVYMRLGNEKKAAEARDQAHRAPKEIPWFDPLRQQAENYLTGKSRGLEVASMFLAQNRIKEAREVLEQLAADYPDDGWVLVALGMTRSRVRDFRGAKQALRLALSKGHDLLLANFHLGALLVRDGEELWERPGGRQAARKKFRQAAQYLRKAIAIKPDHGYSYHKLAVCYLHLNREKEALKTFRVALRYQPEFAEGHIELAEVLFRRGEDEEAVGHLVRSLSLTKPSARARRLWALLLARTWW